jgi:hypothetical protein
VSLCKEQNQKQNKKNKQKKKKKKKPFLKKVKKKLLQLLAIQVASKIEPRDGLQVRYNTNYFKPFKMNTLTININSNAYKASLIPLPASPVLAAAEELAQCVHCDTLLDGDEHCC